jgi:uncharacterized protein (TIGR03435 family)
VSKGGSVANGPVKALNRGTMFALGSTGLLLLACLMGIGFIHPPLALARVQGPAQAFEVASIRQNKDGFIDLGGGARVLSGATRCRGVDTRETPGDPLSPSALGRCTIRNSTLKELIDVAYGMRLGPPRIKVNQLILGGPAWASTTPFDIDAKAENPQTTTGDALISMLQPLLGDRFKLKFHREVREMPGFTLVEAKDGSKLKESLASTQVSVNFTSGQISVQKAPLATLTNFLTLTLGKVVTNKTSLSGLYDFTLTWTPEEGELRPNGTPVVSVALDQPRLPLVVALRDQLGLQLESQRGPVEVIVIDAAEMPDGN